MNVLNLIKKDVLFANRGRWLAYSFLVFTYFVSVSIAILVLNIISDVIGVIDRIYYYENKGEYFNLDIVMYLTLSFMFIVASVIVMSPINLAIKRIIVSNVKTGESLNLDVFLYYENFDNVKKIFKHSLGKIMLVLSRFISYLCVPIVVFYLSIEIFIYADNNMYSMIGALLVGLSIAIFLYFLIRYIKFLTTAFLFDYVALDDFTPTFVKRYEISKSMTKAYRKDIIQMYISFIPLIMSCILIIPIFVVLPYIWTFKAIYANYLIKKYKNEQLILQNI